MTTAQISTLFHFQLTLDVSMGRLVSLSSLVRTVICVVSGLCGCILIWTAQYLCLYRTAVNLAGLTGGYSAGIDPSRGARGAEAWT